MILLALFGFCPQGKWAWDLLRSAYFAETENFVLKVSKKSALSTVQWGPLIVLKSAVGPMNSSKNKLNIKINWQN